MTCRQLLIVAPSVWLLAVSTLFAQANPLSVIPDDALGVAVIRELADTNARVAKLTGKMRIPLPDLLTMAKGYLGVQEGLDEKGSLAAAMFVDPEDEDQFWFVVVAPVADYKALIKPLGADDTEGGITAVTVMNQEMVVAKKAEFAVFATADQRGVVEKVLASTTQVSAKIEPVFAWMAEQQLAVVTTPAGKKLLVDKLKGLIPNVETDGNGDGDAKTAEATAADAMQLIKRLLTAVDEQMTHLAMGVRIHDDTTLRISAHCPFVAGGALAAWSNDVKLAPEAILAGLPPGKFALAYTGESAHLSGDFSSLVGNLSDVALQQVGLPAEARAKVSQALRSQRAGVITISTLLGPARPGESLMSGAISVERVKDAAEHLKAAREAMKILQAELKNPTNDEPIYQVSDVKIGELQAIELVADVGALTGLGGNQTAMAGFMQAFIGRMFGTDGKLRTYIAAADDHTVISTYNKDQLRRAIAHVRSSANGLNVDPDVAKTTSMLKPGSQWIAYVSPQGLLEWVDALLRGMIPGGADFKIPGFAPTEPIGLAAKVSPAGLEAEIVVPESVVSGIGQFIGVVQAMMQAGGQEQP